MWNTYDLSKVDKLFLPDDRVTYLSSEKEGLIKGIASLRKHDADFGFVPGGKKQSNKLWVDGFNTELFGRTAVVTGIWYFQTEKDPPRVQRGPFTFVYFNTDDGWRIAHANFSSYK